MSILRFYLLVLLIITGIIFWFTPDDGVVDISEAMIMISHCILLGFYILFNILDKNKKDI